MDLTRREALASVAGSLSVPSAPPGTTGAGDGWETLVGPSGVQSSLHDAVVLDDGGVLAVGERPAPEGVASVGWVVRLTPGGSVAWRRTFGRDAKSAILRAVVRSGDGLAAVGTKLRSVEDDARRTGWVLRLTPGGSPTRERTYVAEKPLKFRDVATTSDGLWLAGHVGPRVGRQRPFLASADATGDTRWRRTPAIELGSGGVRAVVATPDGACLLGRIAPESGPNRALVARVAPDGSSRWVRRLDTVDSVGATSAVDAVTAGDGFVVAGRATRSGRGEGWIARLAGDGTADWERSLGAEGDHEFPAVLERTPGGYALLGYRYAGSPPDSEAWVVGFDGEGADRYRTTAGTRGRDDEVYGGAHAGGERVVAVGAAERDRWRGWAASVSRPPPGATNGGDGGLPLTGFGSAPAVVALGAGTLALALKRRLGE